MNVFLTLFQQMVPLYCLVLIGFISGKYLGVKKDSIAKLLLYVLLPIVSLYGILISNISLIVLSIPILSFIICTIVALIILFLGNFIWKDGTKNMLAVGIANGNFGFIGLPLTLMLFGQEYIAPVALFGLGAAVFVATFGMFIAAKANYNFKESIMKVVKMPLIYAFFIGLVLNISKVPINNSVASVLNNTVAAYSILGLILVGIAIGELGKIKIEGTLLVFTVIMTYILWPLMAFGFIVLDKNLFMLYSPDIYKILLLMSIVPIGANIVAISTELKVEPEKASFVVLFTTLVSLFYIPLFISVFL